MAHNLAYSTEPHSLELGYLELAAISNLNHFPFSLTIGNLESPTSWTIFRFPEFQVAGFNCSPFITRCISSKLALRGWYHPNVHFNNYKRISWSKSTFCSKFWYLTISLLLLVPSSSPRFFPRLGFVRVSRLKLRDNAWRKLIWQTVTGFTTTMKPSR